MIITLTGLPGAGKSTVADKLAQQLNMSRFSAGDLRRNMAQERGLTLDELNTLGETQDFTDKDVDAYQEKIGKEQDNFVIDGRLSWHFIPNSLKVFLDVELDEAARRIFEASKQGQRPNEIAYESADQVRKALKQRLASDQKRYQRYYKIDYLNTDNYDVVIDTTKKIPEEIVAIILRALDEKQA